MTEKSKWPSSMLIGHHAVHRGPAQNQNGGEMSCLTAELQQSSPGLGAPGPGVESPPSALGPSEHQSRLLTLLGL